MTLDIISPEFLDFSAHRLLRWSQGRRNRRTLVGIAGIPGAGKSTLAHQLVDELNRVEPGCAAYVPMDGFHLPNAVLAERGLRPVKGSPQTFDIEAYIALLLEAQKHGTTPKVPVYDRTLHEPVTPEGDEGRIPATARIIVTEGNYLLVDDLGYERVQCILEEIWLLDTPPEVAKRWLIARHVKGGRSPNDAAAHYERCDQPNTHLVLSKSRPQTYTVRWDDEILRS